MSTVELQPARRRVSTGRALLRSTRPRQWTKNALVLAAPAAAGVLTEAGPLVDTLVAVVAFTLVSAGTYLINDVQDVAADRQHPVKRLRPVASGALAVRSARAWALSMIAAGVGLAFVPTLELGLLVSAYVVLMQAYTLRLKREPVFDIAIVASGFFMRALAGGLAVDVPISRWFLIVTGFGSLFMVTGKRYAEVVQFGEERAELRASLGHYSAAFLQQILTLAGAVAILAYCLWAFEGQAADSSVWSELSIIPFVLAVMRYGLLIDHGRGGEPEEIVLGDRELQILGLLWVLCFVAGIYA
jgi:decaprenyl-phosphate phosphoribosyltransferase